jgi:hypothetical protein
MLVLVVVVKFQFLTGFLLISPSGTPITCLGMSGSTNKSNIMGMGNSKFSQLMSEEKVRKDGLECLNLLLQTDDCLDRVNGSWSWKWDKAGCVNCSESNYSFYASVLPDDKIDRNDVLAPSLHNQRELYFVPSLLTSSQVKTLLDMIAKQIQKQQQGVSPKTKCIVAIEDGEKKALVNKDQSDQCIASFLDPIIINQILPVARGILQEPKLAVADSIVRWYIVEDVDEGSNENLPPHYDLTSFASMIIPLNPEECEGGLYVQYGASHESRRTVDFQMHRHGSKSNKNNEMFGLKAGDAIIHRYDVMHGVNLKKGTRFSLVFWMADEQSIKSRTAPWVTTDAINRKSVHAAFLYAMNAQNGLHGVPKDEKVAQEYWEWASERGHALSQYMLSMLLLRVGFDNDPLRKESKMEWSTRIVSLLKESADRGLDLSQHSLAQTYRYGYHGVAKNESIATKYYIAAARQGYTKSIEALLETVI